MPHTLILHVCSLKLFRWVVPVLFVFVSSYGGKRVNKLNFMSANRMGFLCRET